jgi:hypothetical protein
MTHIAQYTLHESPHNAVRDSLSHLTRGCAVWERNIQLASYSLVIYLPTAVWVLTHIA